MDSMIAMARIATTDREMLTPKDVAPVLGCQPYALNVAARNHPETLGFPVCVIGRRVRIPRQAFLRWMRGEAST